MNLVERGREKLHFIKRHYFPEMVALVVIFGVVGVFASLYASTNRSNLPIPYQGKLLDSNFVPVADGTHYMRFALYTEATGTSTCVWESGSDTGAGNCNSGTSSSTAVTVNRGNFTALLGNTGTNNPAIPQASFNFETNTFYLGITSCGTANSCDAQMTPRRQIGGVPYAYNTDLLDGWDPATGITGGITLVGGTATTDDLILKTTSGAGASGADMIFQVGNNGATEAIRIVNAGLVGIGTTSPQYLLEIATSTTGTADLLRLNNYVAAATSSASQLLFGTNRVTGGMTNIAGISGIITNIGAGTYQGAIAFSTASSTAIAERMRITGGGVVTIGATSTLYGRLGQLLEINTTANYGGHAINTWSATAAESGLIDFNRSKSATVGTHTSVASGDSLGAIIFRGSDGSQFQIGASIEALVDTTAGSSDMPGRLTFNTTADNGTATYERMRIDNAGRVLIGATSTATIVSAIPSLQLEGTDGALANFSITRNSANNAPPIFNLVKTRGTINGTSTLIADDDQLGLIYFAAGDGDDKNSVAARISAFVDGTPGSNDTPGRLTFFTTADGSAAATQRLTILSTGVVIIGGTSDTAYGPGIGQLLEINTSANYGGQVFSTWSATADEASTIHFQASRSATIGTHSTVASGDRLGGMTFNGSDGTAFRNAASIRVYVDGTPGTNDMPGRIALYTTADGANSVTERMRIDSAGNVGIGTSSPSTLLQLGTVGTKRGVVSLAGDTSGLVTVQASSTAGTWTLTLPTTDGTSNQYLQTDGNGVLTWASGGSTNAAGSDTHVQFNDGGTSFGGDAGLTYNKTSDVLTITGASADTTPTAGMKIVNTNTTTNNGSWLLFDVTRTTPPQYTAAAIGGVGLGDSNNGELAFYTDSTGSLMEKMRITASGKVGIGTTTPTYLLTMETAGGGYYDESLNSWVAGSSIRWKENIQPLTNPLEIIAKLKGVQYDWKKEYGSHHSIGFIAEDIGKVLPAVVSWDPNNPQFANGVDYGVITALLTEGIKAQQKKLAPLLTAFTLERPLLSDPVLKIDKEGYVGIGMGTSTLAAALDVRQRKNVDDGIGKEVLGLSSTVTIGDMPNYAIFQGKAITSTTTPTSTINAITVAPDTLYFIEARILQRNNRGDGGSFVIKGAFKTTTSTPPSLFPMSSSTEIHFRDNASSTLSFDIEKKGLAKINVSTLYNIATSTWHSTVFVSSIGK